MKTYLIAYNHYNTETEKDDVEEAIKQLFKTRAKPISDLDVWVIRSEESAEQIRDMLSISFDDDHDKLIVFAVSGASWTSSAKWPSEKLGAWMTKLLSS